MEETTNMWHQRMCTSVLSVFFLKIQIGKKDTREQNRSKVSGLQFFFKYLQPTKLLYLEETHLHFSLIGL